MPPYPWRQAILVGTNHADEDLGQHSSCYPLFVNPKRLDKTSKHCSVALRTRAFASCTDKVRPTFLIGPRRRIPISRSIFCAQQKSARISRRCLAHSRMMRFTNARSTERGALTLPTVNPKRTCPCPGRESAQVETMPRPSRTQCGPLAFAIFPKSCVLTMRADFGKQARRGNASSELTAKVN